MKIKLLSRDVEEYYRGTTKDICKMYKNTDSNLHQMYSVREYTRAINAAKLERVFAKPFIMNLSGHKDVVNIVERHPKNVSWFASSSYDGEIKLWDIKNSSCLTTITHDQTSTLNGLCFSPCGKNLVVLGNNNHITIYQLKQNENISLDQINTYINDSFIQSVDYSLNNEIFGVGGQKISLWNIYKNYPIKIYNIDSDGIINFKFNKIEHYLFATICNSRNFTIYDTRQNIQCMKANMVAKSNSICWHPIEANSIIIGCENYNTYLFDIRNLSKYKSYYHSHTNSIMDVDFSPTGQEFVSASYDRTIRIFNLNTFQSREVYHSQRMQRVFCVRYTADSQYIFCGSDEMNIRVWKTNSNQSLGYLRPRQKASINYNSKLIQKYQNYPQIHRIHNHRHLSRSLFNEKKQIQIELEARKRKNQNLRLFTKRSPSPQPTIHHVDD